ncbi:ISL3 family transposase ISMac21 [Desulfosarcina alkanivorans]|uniref:ISL3 family transposase ISMac21 n=1 Tax=Desulfosarcina alkanivorans TaxID=571177 RepID=A0A5K7YC95_9BACT|nr:ISL3 family transposase [Desulfosarcina alkanivorans]BBO67042.1 ISL3 family transposase ISMac21 [Desulfosarcina alkanivorans]
MKDTELLQIALGLAPPWQVSAAEFDSDKERLDICLDFPKGSTFTCPTCGQIALKAYDPTEKTWRHLNFFQHEAYLTVRVARIDCDKCGTHLVDVPWARPGSGFTLLFEAMIMVLAKAMPVKTIATFVNEHDTRLWRILHHYVDKARKDADQSQVKQLGVDETSRRRGHNYVSLFVDLDESRVLFATDGKDASTVQRFKQDLIEHGGDPGAIEEMCCDMSLAFISGVEKQFPEAHLTFEKFHVIKILNDAVDQVRREEIKDRPELKGSRYIWLKNQPNLKASQSDLLEQLTIKKLNLKTSRAYHIKLNFQEMYQQPFEFAEAFLKKWYFWATHSRLEPIINAAKTIKNHWDGVLRWFTSKINNGILEGINSLIQAAKARARGYRTKRNLITMIYLISGKLNFDLPT